MKKAILLMAVLALAGCSKDPVASVQTNNQAVSIDELFTHDGVTVWRFNDAGHYVYFTSPPTNVKSSYTQHFGKGCAREVAVQTLTQGIQP